MLVKVQSGYKCKYGNITTKDVITTHGNP